MSVIEITSTSKLKSMDTISERENHSGKKNRGKYKHANEKINTALSKYNVEFDFYNMRDLLHKHYDEKIENHNKNNNSESRRWGLRDGTLDEQRESSLDAFLDSFQGKQMNKRTKKNNMITKNERWATIGQISYFGSRHTLNPILEKLEAVGASKDEIRNIYAKSYERYVLKHNEMFPTLPIYASDVHFDETTYHGHDHIVAMGHTKTGNPSESLDNALGELYGYGSNFAEKTANVKKYRSHNDRLIHDEMTAGFEWLANKYNVKIDFKPLRTGAEGGLSIDEYERQEDMKVAKKKHDKRSATLDDREESINQKMIEVLSLEESNLLLLEQRMEQIRFEDEENKREEAKLLRKELFLKSREEDLRFKQKEQMAKNAVFDRYSTAIVLAVLSGVPGLKKQYELIEEYGVFDLDLDGVIDAVNLANEEKNRIGPRRGRDFIEKEYQRQKEKDEDELEM